MNILKWALILTGLVTLLSLVLVLTGLYTNPMVGGAGFVSLAIVIDFVVIFLALKQTAGEKQYVQQLLRGVAIGLVAGVLIFGSSLLLTAVIFPDYIDQMQAGYTEFIEASPLSDQQRDEQLEIVRGATSLNQASPGMFGTFGVSLLAASIIGIFVCRKRR